MKDQLNQLLNKSTQLQQDLIAIQSELKELKDGELNAMISLESDVLQKRFYLVMLILVMIIFLSSVLLYETYSNTQNILFACLVAAVNGSTVSAFLSALNRRANGWEFSDGQKYPVGSKPDRFSMRMSIFFLMRPLLGILAGFIIYFGFSIISHAQVSGAEESHTLIFWSLIAGLFAKSLIQKLKDLFDNLIGS